MNPQTQTAPPPPLVCEFHLEIFSPKCDAWYRLETTVHKHKAEALLFPNDGTPDSMENKGIRSSAVWLSDDRIGASVCCYDGLQAQALELMHNEIKKMILTFMDASNKKSARLYEYFLEALALFHKHYVTTKTPHQPKI